MSLLPIALAVALVQGSPAASEDYVVGDVSSSIASDAILGSIGSGLACVPVGKLRWTDIAKAPPSAWIEAGQRALVDARLGAVADRSTKDSGRYRMTILVKALKLDLCLAWLGIGKKPRGKGVATVDLAVRDTVANVDLPGRTMEIELNLRGRDPRKDDTVLTQAVGEAVRTFIATRNAD